MKVIEVDTPIRSLADFRGTESRTPHQPRKPRTFRMFTLLTVALDLLLIAVATMLASLGREQFTWFDPATDVRDHVQFVAAFIMIGWIAILWLLGSHKESLVGAGIDEYKILVNGSLATAGLVCIVGFLTKYPLSRGFYVMEFALGIPLLLVGRLVVRRILQGARTRGHFSRRVLIAGTPAHVDEIAAVLGRERWLGYSVVGALTPRAESRTATYSGVPILGRSAEAAEAISRVGVDTVFFAGGAFGSASDMRQASWDLERTGVHLIVAPSVTDVSAERIKVRPVAGLPLVHLGESRSMHASHWAKRAFDLAGASCAMVMVLPLVVVVALWVKLYDGGPVLYRQTRVGRDGRLFGCYKFRSMVTNADRQVGALRASEKVDDVLFKLANDPRVTKPGRVIRRYSLDELPQLWNVLRGDMSLVGPRPPIPSEVARYEHGMTRRLRVRPGITGLWQVSGRSDLSWSDTVRLDLYYVDNWSMVQDLAIVAKTVGAVIRSRGAY